MAQPNDVPPPRGSALGNLDPITEVADEANAASTNPSARASRSGSFAEGTDVAVPPAPGRPGALRGLAGALKKVGRAPAGDKPAAGAGDSGSVPPAAPSDGSAGGEEEEMVTFEVVQGGGASGEPEKRYAMVLKRARLGKLTMGKLKKNLAGSVGWDVSDMVLSVTEDESAPLEDAWTAADIGVGPGAVIRLSSRQSAPHKARVEREEEEALAPPPPAVTAKPTMADLGVPSSQPTPRKTAVPNSSAKKGLLGAMQAANRAAAEAEFAAAEAAAAAESAASPASTPGTGQPFRGASSSPASSPSMDTRKPTSQPRPASLAGLVPYAAPAVDVSDLAVPSARPPSLTASFSPSAWSSAAVEAASAALSTPLDVPPALTKRMKLRKLFSSIQAADEGFYGSPNPAMPPSSSSASPGAAGLVSRAELAAALSSDLDATSWQEYDALVTRLLVGDETGNRAGTDSWSRGADSISWPSASELLQEVIDEVSANGPEAAKTSARTRGGLVGGARGGNQPSATPAGVGVGVAESALAAPAPAPAAPASPRPPALQLAFGGGAGPAPLGEAGMPAEGEAAAPTRAVPVPPSAAKYTTAPHASFRDVVLEVEVADGRVVDLPIRVGDDPLALATAFVSQHRLPAGDVLSLADLIRPRLQQALEMELADARAAVGDAVSALGTANGRIEAAGEAAAAVAAARAAEAVPAPAPAPPPAPPALGITREQMDAAVASAIAEVKATAAAVQEAAVEDAVQAAVAAAIRTASAEFTLALVQAEEAATAAAARMHAGAVAALTETHAAEVSALTAAYAALEEKAAAEKAIGVAQLQALNAEVTAAQEEAAAERARGDAARQEAALRIQEVEDAAASLLGQLARVQGDVVRVTGEAAGLREELGGAEVREGAALARGDALAKELSSALANVARMEKALEAAALRIAETEGSLEVALGERDSARASTDAANDALSRNLSTMEEWKVKTAEAMKRKSAWEKYVENAYDASGEGGAASSILGAVDLSASAGSGQAGGEPARRASSALASAMAAGDWRAWAGEKRDILARANADRAALIEENKRLRASLGAGGLDTESRLRSMDEAAARLQGEVLQLTSAHARAEGELSAVYRQWEEDGRRWAAEQARLVAEVDSLAAALQQQRGGDAASMVY